MLSCCHRVSRQSPLLTKTGATFQPILHVSDWFKTLLSAALSADSAADKAAAEAELAGLFATGPIDSVDQWAALSSAAVSAAESPKRRASHVALHATPPTGSHTQCSRQEGWHFSCVRETIMERQVHFQSSD